MDYSEAKIAILLELNTAIKEGGKAVRTLKQAVLSLMPLQSNGASDECVRQIGKVGENLDRIIGALERIAKVIER